MRNSCCIVVPIYRTDLPDIEWAALLHNREVLRDVPFIAVAPEGLDISPITDRVDFLDCKRYNPDFFQSPQTYNKLLVNLDFWQDFTDYDYMLIAQLDVVIFDNELDMWCDKGYDYIGAPWLNGFGRTGVISPVVIQTLFKFTESDSIKLYQFLKQLNVLDDLDILVHDFWKYDIVLEQSPLSHLSSMELASAVDEIESLYNTFVGVGNGGLSLRNISSAINLLTEESLPATTNLSTVQMEHAPLMADDLKRFRDGTKAFHDLNKKVIEALDRLPKVTPYMATIIELLRDYTPARSDAVFKIKNAVAKLAETKSELIPIVEILSNMRGDLVKLFVRDMIIPEDFFWGEFAPLFSSTFKVAPVQEALQFSFECNPRFCYTENGKKLPLGCHAWQLPQNLKFWKEFDLFKELLDYRHE